MPANREVVIHVVRFKIPRNDVCKYYMDWNIRRPTQSHVVMMCRNRYDKRYIIASQKRRFRLEADSRMSHRAGFRINMWIQKKDDGASGFTCGHKINAKIVGGEEVAKNSIPWQVGLLSRYSNQPFCGGTLISPYVVLTAAHCTGSDLHRVSVEEHDISVADGEKIHNVACYVDHPRYNKRTGLDYDFSILILETSVDIGTSSSARAACLPTDPSEKYIGKKMTVSGWGRTSDGGPGSAILKAVNVPTMSNRKCKRFYGSHHITSSMLCAGHKNGGLDSCQGDSGGNNRCKIFAKKSSM